MTECKYKFVLFVKLSIYMGVAILEIIKLWLYTEFFLRQYSVYFGPAVAGLIKPIVCVTCGTFCGM